MKIFLLNTLRLVLLPLLLASLSFFSSFILPASQHTYNLSVSPLAAFQASLQRDTGIPDMGIPSKIHFLQEEERFSPGTY